MAVTSVSALDPGLVEAVFFVKSSRRARLVLERLARFGRRNTVDTLQLGVGRVSKDDYWVLRRLEALRLIKRYRGVDENGHWVVWNEITPLGRRVLEVIKSMDAEG